MQRILVAAIALFFAGGARAEEDVALKAGAGREVVENWRTVPAASLDYPRINAPFLDRQGWETEVNKMITAYGAPIDCRPTPNHRRLSHCQLRQRPLSEGAGDAAPTLGAGKLRGGRHGAGPLA